jgi:RNA-directed DNA polymerase
MIYPPLPMEASHQTTTNVDFLDNCGSERALTRRTFLNLLAAAGVLGGLDAGPVRAETALTPLDDAAILTILGVIQPAGKDAVRDFIKAALPELGSDPDAAYLDAAFERHLVDQRILRVRQMPRELFSLTAVGNAWLPRNAQLLRDKARLFLMRGRARANVSISRGSGIRVGGVPPSSWVRASIEDFVASPVPYGSRALADRKSGKRPLLRDTFPKLLSFESVAQVNTALRNTDLATPLSIDGLALCLGVSTALLTWFANTPEKSYREFLIPKRSGGTRSIESPRIFLKVTQRLLLQFILSDLKVHESVYSFRQRRSSATNAMRHEGQNFVGGLDIRNYFGSVTLPMVINCLVDNGFDPAFAKTLGPLLTRRGILPQGAPTSPVLSNALLFAFDQQMSSVCATSGLNYSRYADDIVVSGPMRPPIEEAFEIAGRELQTRYGLLLNEGKTRIMPRWTRQIVTGAVVNKTAMPPRSLRRIVRAMFYEAEKDPARFAHQANRLRGYIGYLGAFPSLRNSRELLRYRAILNRVKRA